MKTPEFSAANIEKAESPWKETAARTKRIITQAAIWLSTAAVVMQASHRKDAPKNEHGDKKDFKIENVYGQVNVGQGDNAAEKAFNIAVPVTVGVQETNDIKGEYNINLPYVYGEDFEKVQTTEEGKERTEEMATYIESQLKETFGNSIRENIFHVGFFESATFKSFQASHPEEAARMLSYNHLKPSKIKISGYSSPEAIIHGAHSLKQGHVDAENVELAKKRAQDPAIIEALKSAGIEIDGSVQMGYEGFETQFSDSDVEALIQVALENHYVNEKIADGDKDSQALWESLESMVSDYSLGKLAGKPVEKKLDELVGSKRHVNVSIEFETEQSETVFIPIPLTIFLLSLGVQRLLRKKEKQPEEEKKIDPPEEEPHKGEDDFMLSFRADQRIFSEKFNDLSDEAMKDIPHGRAGFEKLYDAVVHSKEIAPPVSAVEGIREKSIEEFLTRVNNPVARSRGLDYVAFTKEAYQTYIHQVYREASQARVSNYFRQQQEAFSGEDQSHESKEAFYNSDLLHKEKSNEQAFYAYRKIASGLAAAVIGGYEQFLKDHPEIEQKPNKTYLTKGQIVSMIKDFEDPMLKASAPKGYPHDGSRAEQAAFIAERFTNSSEAEMKISKMEVQESIENALNEKRQNYLKLVGDYEALKRKNPITAFAFQHNLDSEKYTMSMLRKEVEKIAFTAYERLVRKAKQPVLDVLPEVKEKYMKEVTERLLAIWQDHDRTYDLQPEPSYIVPAHESQAVTRLPNFDIARRHMRMANVPIREDGLREAVAYENDPSKVLFGVEMTQQIINPIVEDVFIEASEVAYKHLPTEMVIETKVMNAVEKYTKEEAASKKEN